MLYGNIRYILPKYSNSNNINYISFRTTKKNHWIIRVIVPPTESSSDSAFFDVCAGGEIAQLVMAQGWWPWEQEYESCHGHNI